MALKKIVGIEPNTTPYDVWMPRIALTGVFLFGAYAIATGHDGVLIASIVGIGGVIAGYYYKSLK